MPDDAMVEVRGKKVTCSHCGGGSFESRRVQLNTAVMTFFNMDFLNKSADVFICSHCGHLEWFLNPDVTDEETVSENTCVVCGKPIPRGHEKCGMCR